MRPKTSHRTPAEHVPEWHLVDAEGKVLGRLARDIAMVLMGKHRPTWSPHYDSGDHVVVVNCEKIQVTGVKAQNKTYARVTGYPGGRVVETYADLLERHPDRILRKAVQRMLPKTVLGRRMLKKLRIYAGPEHPHAAQQPKPFAGLN
ncbi:MAG: 50S ribosomal protein L13 [Planctomycetota bacterium]|nr:MAG: 50S ribosomal protein L13 [Planctomycetota bacterium]